MKQFEVVVFVMLNNYNWKKYTISCKNVKDMIRTVKLKANILDNMMYKDKILTWQIEY